MKRLIGLACVALAMGGCTSEWDMNGTDPKDYYAEHPIKNSLEAQTATASVHFNGGEKTLSGVKIDQLASELHGISPAAVQSVRIMLAQSDVHNHARQDYLRKLMHHMGYVPEAVFTVSAMQERGDAHIDVNYLTVIAPDCPDWHTSPVTTYSNTMQGNFGCATEVNLGLMVADPHDLVRGTGDISPDGDRNAKVISDYRSGKDFGASGSSGSGSSGSSGGGPAASGLTPPAGPPTGSGS
jgi:pilus biogenesis lipoprotein CpaD